MTQRGARPVEDGPAQVRRRRRRVAQAGPVRVQGHEGVLDDLLGLPGVVEEQPREPDERLPVRGIQLGHGVVGRALRAAVLAHGGHCHVLLTPEAPHRLTRP